MYRLNHQAPASTQGTRHSRSAELTAWRLLTAAILATCFWSNTTSMLCAQQLSQVLTTASTGSLPLASSPTAHTLSGSTKWRYEAVVDIFHLHSDFELDDLTALQSILGELRKEIGESLQLPPLTTKVHVVLFSSARQYSRYMQHYFPTISTRRAIYLQDRGPGMLFTYWHDDIDSDLRHEATHAILNQTGIQLPLWLDEGLAEYFELPPDDRYRKSGYLGAVAERAARGRVPSLLQLERLENMADFGDDHYRDSWAWIHYFLHRSPDSRKLLIDYIARHRRQVNQLPLVKQLTELNADPVTDFQQHFSTLQVRAISP